MRVLSSIPWAALALVAGCGGEEGAREVRVGEVAAAATTIAPRALLGALHRASAEELDLAALGRERARHDAVRALAGRLARDLRYAERRARAVAERHALALVPPAPAAADGAPEARAAGDLGATPEGAPPSAAELLAALRAAPPEEFDAAFLAAVVARHGRAIGELQAAVMSLAGAPRVAPATRDAVELVRALLPILRQHLALARDLQDELDPPVLPGASR